MEIQVKVMAEHVMKEQEWEALTAYFIFVALDENGKPQKVPPLILETEEEEQLFNAGEERYTTCRLDERSRILCAID
jgi:acyl-CoA hydrolase